MSFSWPLKKGLLPFKMERWQIATRWCKTAQSLVVPHEIWQSISWLPPNRSHQICGSINLDCRSWRSWSLLLWVVWESLALPRSIRSLWLWETGVWVGGEKELWCMFNEQDLIRNIDMRRHFRKPDNFCWVWHAHDNWWPLIPFFSPCSSVYRSCSHQLAQRFPDFNLGSTACYSAWTWILDGYQRDGYQTPFCTGRIHWSKTRKVDLRRVFLQTFVGPGETETFSVWKNSLE